MHASSHYRVAVVLVLFANQSGCRGPVLDLAQFILSYSSCYQNSQEHTATRASAPWKGPNIVIWHRQIWCLALSNLYVVQSPQQFAGKG